jgi:hypothetical protein
MAQFEFLTAGGPMTGRNPIPCTTPLRLPPLTLALFFSQDATKNFTDHTFR